MWRVSWSKEYTIDTIVLYNRADCCQERLIGATVRVNDQIVGTVARSEDMMRFQFSGLNVTTSQVEVWGGTEGPALEALSLAEVEVFLVEDETSTLLPLLYLAVIYII